jgi:hypothetical protein
MFDLGVALPVPMFVAGVTSSVFDVVGIYLALLSIQYAKTEDSGFFPELGTYLFIAASTYIVTQHGILLGYPTAGIVMFAAAPIALGVILKATLHYITRQQRRAAGRVTEKLPSVGFLTWVRYAPQSFRLVSVAMQGRIINAADKLNIVEDKHKIFETPIKAVVLDSDKAGTTSQDIKILSLDNLETEDKVSHQLSQAVRPALTSSDNMSLPDWLPQEPDMKLSTLARTCLDNGVLDLETMFRYAVAVKGQNVNRLSLSKALGREKTKLS